MTAQEMLWRHLEGVEPAPEYASLEEQARAAECFETPAWAAQRILEVELLTPRVWDPCCGTGVLSEAAQAAGYAVVSTDLHDWGYRDQVAQKDFLRMAESPDAESGEPFSVFMNPPFSHATDFVDRAADLGARKILCFQRFPWRESRDRRAWWAAHPPARIWLCGDRATCWRFDIPPEQRTSGATTAHAWYVWEHGHRGLEAVHTLWKDGWVS
ncbi:hypothetical protein [Roseospira navarrensis]|uniref:Methyltransferase n=1 Tax=Roseospira navarrensis TaxID=140058 RepID=A0A7X1ZE27_9PROT|nr:hypothetical protein [Roseospira navarrensis]MQX36838.1 hypothetical protein [Roseospira navarrensis]